MDLSLGSYWIQSILRPDFTWPRPMQGTISQHTPPVPGVPSKLSLIAWGMVHKALYHVSRWYCAFFDMRFDAHILQLPFGLVLKWNGRASVEEAIATQMARAAGMPVPKVLCCGEHLGPKSSHMRFSILMTRLPGVELNNGDYPLEIEAEGAWPHELKACILAMRSWCPPNPNSICSPIGTALRSTRVPHHIMGSFISEREFYDHLFSPASTYGFKSTTEYEETLLCAKKLQQQSHRIVFTHGDLKAHNILVGDDGHLSGFLDWESGGWYPEYWEFTTAMRFGRNTWWFKMADWMGGG